jgi:PHP family Zn ribbon phosphoesterase
MLNDKIKGDKPEKTHPFYFRVYLLEILSEICHSGYRSKKIQQYYMNVISHLGPELSVLDSIPISDIDMAGIPKLGEAIYRMRHDSAWI